MYSEPQCAYVIDGNHIVTDKSIAKKVSGTSMGGILGISPWSTPFQVACNLLGLGREDISGSKAIQRGIALEPKILKYADETWSEAGVFMSAEEVYAKREGDHDSWVSDFEDEIFAGHVDGLVIRDEGDYILEVKTTRDPTSWENGVPEYYFWQVAVYNHFLTRKSRVYFVLGIATEVTDRDPASWVPNEDNCILIPMDIDDEQVQAKMEEITEWYNTYIRNGVTPDYDPENPDDVELYNHLVNLSMDSKERSELLEELVKAQADLDRIRAENNIDVQEKYVDSLKKKVKDTLVSGNITGMTNQSKTVKVELQKRETVSWNEGKMVADGIDPEAYKIRKTTYAMSVKPITKK